MSIQGFKKLLNRSEDATFSELRRVTDLAVYPKVRVADVLPIEASGIAPSLYTYALKAHFDFIVARHDHTPVFAVEFDGPSHRTPAQKLRDEMKNALCEAFELPLLRINSDYLSRRYNDRTLLAWIVEVYEIAIAFDEAQRRGDIPEEEGFDPINLSITTGSRTESFPYMIGRQARDQLTSWYESGRVHDRISSGVIWRDEQEVIRGLEFVRISATHGVACTTGMQRQLFPVDMTDLIDELLAIFVVEKLEQCLAGEIPAEPLGPTIAEFDRRLTGIGRRAHYIGLRPMVRGFRGL